MEQKFFALFFVDYQQWFEQTAPDYPQCHAETEFHRVMSCPNDSAPGRTATHQFKKIIKKPKQLWEEMN
ncbi:MAG: hypothetical protein R2738_09340 [Bacteroides graminisolvens]